MWLASLCRLVDDTTRSRHKKLTRPQRRRIIPRLDHLEDRIVPSTINVNAGDTTGFIAAVTQANSDYAATSTSDTILLNANTQSSSVYNFTAVNNTTKGPNVLPVITAKGLTIVGNGSTANAGGYGRLFDVSATASLTVTNLTLTGGKVTGSAAKGGAVYNSGNLSMKSVIVAGNQATGGAGQNAAGGGIYSNGGSLTLVNDVIGRTVKKTASFKLSYKTYTTVRTHSTKTVGASNQATGGTGGSGQGAGLYVSGGTVNVSHCTIGGNQVAGSASAQGGGLYVNSAKLNLNNDVIGRYSVQKITLSPVGATTAAITAFTQSTKTTGSTNRATGGSAMGAGLYVSGGSVSVSGGAIAGDQAIAGAGLNAAGGGVYVVGVPLVFNKVALSHDSVHGGNGVSGGNGGNAQGGELFISGGQASLTNCQVTNSGPNADLAGNGGAGGGGGGNAQGGGIYAFNTVLTLKAGTIVDYNRLAGGKGGSATAHHLNGGNGGNAQGGGVFASATTVTLTGGATIFDNFAQAGKGGAGGCPLSSAKQATVNQKGGTPGGQGGNGGVGQGGGLYANGGSVTIAGINNAADTAVTFNSISGGQGGRGGRGGAGFAHGQTGGIGGAAGAGGEGQGGGIYLNAAPLTVSGGVTFATNVVNGGTGGHGGRGGAGWRTFRGTKGTLKSSFGGNGGAGVQGGLGGVGQGGGLFAAGSNLTISLGNAAGDIVMENNQAVGGHGGFGGAGDVVGGTTFLDGRGGNGGNGGLANGGGAAIFGDKLLLTNTDLQANFVQGGGGGTNKGLYSNYNTSSGTATTSHLGGGGSATGGAGGSGQGGGLYVSGSSSVTILNSTLADNSADYLNSGPNSPPLNYGNGGNGGNGGKLGTALAKNGNSKEHGGNGGVGGANQGAGLYAASSTLTVLNSTIADNTLYDALGGAGGTGALGAGSRGANGSSQGAGIFAANGSLSLINDTIVWNFLYPTSGTVSSTDLGVGIFNDPSNPLTLQNTIIAHDQIYNSATLTSTPSDLYGAAAAASDHNLIGDGSGSSGLVNGANGNQVGTDAAPIDPLFSVQPPAGAGLGQQPVNYGGLTPTLPLDGKSPAINAGDPAAMSAIASAEGVASSSAVDQRGLPRLVNGAIDIGATEMQVDFAGSPSVTSVQAGGAITYTLIVTNGEGAPLNVTLTDVVPTNTGYIANSAGGTGWTITQPSATNNNTLTATATLNPGVSAALTFSVTVASNVGNTTIADTASIAWTGNDASGSQSVLMDTAVTGGMSSTTTTLTSSANPSVFAQSVTFTAKVSNSSTSAPAGSVTFYNGTTMLGTGTLSGGVATFTTSTLAVGSYSITAVYGGDTNDYGSTSNTLTQAVNKDSTTTTVDSSADPSLLGQSVTLKANVTTNSPGAGTPTGNVTFYDGATALGKAALSNGVAVFTTSTLAVGSHSISAVYSGDANDLGSASSTLRQQVDYHFGGFQSPLSNHLHFEVNRTIPVKFALSTYNGTAITSLSAVKSLLIQALDANGNPVGAPFPVASPGNQGLQYTGGHYQFNWQTKGLAAGSYEIILTLADGTTQTKTIQLVSGGSGSNAQSANGSVVSDGTAAGHLLGGDIGLYVNNSNGELTADELARIQDAVNAVDAVTAPYGVNVFEVTNATQAQATLRMSANSPVGGYAQGVLGCYTTTGAITLIQGWNWYAGSAPTLIGLTQYDFQTTVTHELGHALGLGESSLATSAMYGTLTPGTTIRSLTNADLNIPYAEGFAGAQQAVPPVSPIAPPVAGTGQGTTPPPSTSSPSNGSPVSVVDQLFADLARLLNDLSYVYQAQLAAASALWQQIDALALQRLDATLGLDAGAMGMVSDALLFALLSA